jgi:hypothetical protein
MMIEDDDIDAAPAERGDGVDGGGAAIDGQEQSGGELVEALFDPIRAQAVTFLQAMRQVAVRVPAEPGQDFGQEGGGGDAIDVVVAEDDDWFPGVAGAEEAVDRGGHIGQLERVGKIAEAGFEEILDLRRFAQAAVEEALDEEGRQVKGFGQLTGEQRLGRFS